MCMSRRYEVVLFILSRCHYVVSGRHCHSSKLFEFTSVTRVLTPFKDTVQVG
jgi:hypothetical protein